MYKLIYRVESNKKTREITVYALNMSSVLMEGVLHDFAIHYPKEIVIRAYLHKMIIEE